MNPRLEIIEADLGRGDHQQAVRALTAAYALDPMGNGGPLPGEALEGLIEALRRTPTALIFLAYEEGRAVGIATCFLGLSTFQAKPLLNIHDLAVVPSHRGLGIGRRLLAAAEHKARSIGCCRVTLEVHENNLRAKHLYASTGFTQPGHGNASGGALFYSKSLP